MPTTRQMIEAELKREGWLPPEEAEELRENNRRWRERRNRARAAAAAAMEDSDCPECPVRLHLAGVFANYRHQAEQEDIASQSEHGTLRAEVARLRTGARIGPWLIRESARPGWIRIERAEEPGAGEGGEFSRDALAAVIAQFYDENF